MGGEYGVRIRRNRGRGAPCGLKRKRNDNAGVDEFETAEVLQRLAQSTSTGNPRAIVLGVFGTIHPVTTMVTP